MGARDRETLTKAHQAPDQTAPADRAAHKDEPPLEGADETSTPIIS